MALGKACEIAARDLDQKLMQMRDLRDRLHQGLADGLTGVRLNGERTLILVDRSASMLSDSVANVIIRRNRPEAEQLRARKWRQVVATVN